MSLRRINAYAQVNGAEQAIELYKSALGATVVVMTRYSEVPGMPAPPEIGNLVIHAHLRIGEGDLMITDGTPDRPVPGPGNISVALDFTDVASGAKAFDALAEGGQVLMPLTDAFWGAKFGLVVDKFGVQWMFSCSLNQTEA